MPRRGAWSPAASALGIVGSLVVAGFAERIASALEGFGQEMFNAGVLLAATAMLGWHNVWMKRHGADLARQMSAVGHDVSGGAASLSVLLVVVGLAVLREGSEIVLFLYGTRRRRRRRAAVGRQRLGLAGGVAIGWALYRGLVVIPPRYLFTVTSWLPLLLAAGMAAQAAGFLVQAGKLPALADPCGIRRPGLPQHSVFGQVLHALIGYSERPSGMQLVFFVAVVVLGVAMRMINRPTARNTTGSAAYVVSAAVVLVTMVIPARAHAAHVVYSPIVDEGEFAIEYRGHHDFDGSNDADGGEQHKLELEYAPRAHWLTEVLGEWEREPGGDLEATEIAWENIFQLTEQGQHWADFGLLAEFAHSLEDGGGEALELGALGRKAVHQKRRDVQLLASAPSRAVQTELEYAFRWRYRLNEAFEPGIELHGELGEWGEFGSLGDHRQQAGPSLLGKLPGMSDYGGFKYQAALLFGLTSDSPDATLRLQLEYEF
jgi:high-affinity iron transporter